MTVYAVIAHEAGGNDPSEIVGLCQDEKTAQGLVKTFMADEDCYYGQDVWVETHTLDIKGE